MGDHMGKLMLGSLAISIILYLVFIITDEGAVLAYILAGLLVSFIGAMIQLGNR